MFASNQEFVVTGEGYDDLKETLKLVDKLYAIRKKDENFGHQVQGFKYDENCFAIYWIDDKDGVSPVPPTNCKKMASMVSSYLKSVASYDNADGECYGDGSSYKGWKVWHDDKDFYTVIKISPFWTYCGK